MRYELIEMDGFVLSHVRGGMFSNKYSYSDSVMIRGIKVIAITECDKDNLMTISAITNMPIQTRTEPGSGTVLEYFLEFPLPNEKQKYELALISWDK